MKHYRFETNMGYDYEEQWMDVIVMKKYIRIKLYCQYGFGEDPLDTVELSERIRK